MTSIRAIALLTVILSATLLAASPVSSRPYDASELLARYQPFVYTYSSDWKPIAVEPFLASSDLERLTRGRWRVIRSNPSATSLGKGSPSIRLDLRPCTPARNLDACYRAHAPAGDPSVYGRAWVNPDQGAVQTVLEYWYFYALNDWRNPPAKPAAWQIHEGDWEAVLISLDSADAPLEVAASQHSAGVVRPWRTVRKIGGTHPVVYAALGSHANYFLRGFRGRAGQPHRIPTAFSGVPVQEPDFTSAQTSLGPPGLARTPLKVIDISSGAPWLSFAGAWGDGNYLLAGSAKGYTRFRVGNSPPGPAFHRSWLDPLGVFRTWPADDGH
jgi:hypothetical protein